VGNSRYLSEVGKVGEVGGRPFKNSSDVSWATIHARAFSCEMSRY
jgi:hypothetical protein